MSTKTLLKTSQESFNQRQTSGSTTHSGGFVSLIWAEVKIGAYYTIIFEDVIFLNFLEELRALQTSMNWAVE